MFDFLFISQADANTTMIGLLLLMGIYYASGINKRLKTWATTPAKTYLNTQAKLKALDSAPNGIVVIDIDGIVVAWTGGSSTMFGYKEEEVVGHPITLIIPNRYREAHTKAILKAKITGKSEIAGRTIKLEGLRKDGSEFPIELNLAQWRDGLHTFYTGIIQDLTNEKILEAELEKSLKMYTNAEQIDGRGCWTWDVLEDVVNVSKGFEKIFDIDKGEMNSSDLLERVHFDDLPRVEAEIKKAFDKKQGYSIQYRVVKKNGAFLPVEVNTCTDLNERGELIRITGTIHVL